MNYEKAIFEIWLQDTWFLLIDHHSIWNKNKIMTLSCLQHCCENDFIDIILRANMSKVAF
jgi:hypothetical protein